MNDVSNLSIFGIVISTDNNSIAPKGVLGIVLHQYYNSFARKTASVIVFENNQFSDFLDTDIDEEFILTDFNTGALLKGISFIDDNKITEAIKSDVLGGVFKSIRSHLEKAESNETASN